MQRRRPAAAALRLRPGIAVVFGLGPACACLGVAVTSLAVRLTLARMGEVRGELALGSPRA